MECGMVTQKAIIQLLSLLCFVSLQNKMLRGLRNTKVCGFHCCAKILKANDKMLMKALLRALPLIRLRYYFQQIKSLHNCLITFQNRYIILP